MTLKYRGFLFGGEKRLLKGELMPKKIYNGQAPRSQGWFFNEKKSYGYNLSLYGGWFYARSIFGGCE
jgi:hypothetical protein